MLPQLSELEDDWSPEADGDGDLWSLASVGSYLVVDEDQSSLTSSSLPTSSTLPSPNNTSHNTCLLTPCNNLSSSVSGVFSAATSRSNLSSYFSLL